MTDLPLETGPLPLGSVNHKGVGWWGILCVIATEGALFAYLPFSYYYFDVQAHASWIPETPKLTLALPDTIVLLASSVAIWWAEKSLKEGRRGRQLLGTAIAFVLGVIFVAVQYKEWLDKPFTLQTSPYGSLYFTTTGFHMAHVAAGLVGLLLAFIWSALGYFSPRRYAPFSIAAIYWHFVDAVWLAVFFTYYVTPRLW